MRLKSPFFTIGHSNRTLEEFVQLLTKCQIDLVADVRRIPRSRANPQFNKGSLPAALEECDISYEHMAALGGRRGKAQHPASDINGFWTNVSFRNYADYALTGDFQTGLKHLLEEEAEQRCAIMCSEAVWWRCHRRIITDYLMARGEIVFHIMGPGRVELAQMTSGAVVQSDGTVIYPAMCP